MDRYPQEVMENFSSGGLPSPSSLCIRKSLEHSKDLYKNEGVSPPEAINQYSHCTGYTKILELNGLRQRPCRSMGSALSFACCLWLECRSTWWGSLDSKTLSPLMMNTWEQTVSQSSKDTNAGRKIWRNTQILPEALGCHQRSHEDAVTTRTPILPGSVLNHVMMHQTIIGFEAKKQLDKIWEKKVDIGQVV